MVLVVGGVYVYQKNKVLSRTILNNNTQTTSTIAVSSQETKEFNCVLTQFTHARLSITKDGSIKITNNTAILVGDSLSNIFKNNEDFAQEKELVLPIDFQREFGVTCKDNSITLEERVPFRTDRETMVIEFKDNTLRARDFYRSVGHAFGTDPDLENLNTKNLMSNQNISAKRTGPKEIAPLVYKDKIYTVPHFGILQEDNYVGGHVLAHDNITGKKIWDTEVYPVRHLEKNGSQTIEKDVMDVFITQLSIVGDKLIIVNEKNQHFELDPETGKSTFLRPSGQ